jgi:hypothetical protein
MTSCTFTGCVPALCVFGPNACVVEKVKAEEAERLARGGDTSGPTGRGNSAPNLGSGDLALRGVGDTAAGRMVSRRRR